MKKENLLSKNEMKNILGADKDFSCLPIGSPCMHDIECCSGPCIVFPGAGFGVCTGSE